MCDSNANIDNVSNGVNNELKVKKRDNYLSWDDYFMSVAMLSAMRSKDPNTQVGACIVSEDNKLVGIGYNGMPIGCSDDSLPWARTADSVLDTKYPYVCHAELNAVINKNSADIRNCTIYTVLFPCNECAKIIIQSRIKRIVYLCDRTSQPEYVASKTLLGMAGIETIQFTPTHSQITIDFDILQNK